MVDVHIARTPLLVLLAALVVPWTAAGDDLPAYPVDLSSPQAPPQCTPLALDAGPLALGGVRLSLQFSGSYLPLEHRATHLTQLRIDHALGLAAGAAVGFGPADVGVALPMALNLAGQLEGLAWQASTVGDLVLVPRVAPIPRGRRPVDLILAVPVTFPTGDEARYAGHTGLTAEPQLQISVRAGRLAAVIRPGVRILGGRKLALPYFSDWLTLLAAVGVELGSGRHVRPEIGLRGVVPVQGAGGASGELVAGLTVRPARGLEISAHASAGLGDMPGVPRVRVLGSVAWRGGGGSGGRGQTADLDMDGYPDPLDECPGAAEDVDGHRDDDGCPDPDNDGDGNPDVSDGCPDRAGLGPVGCPPGILGVDLDGDGVEGEDACPLRPEDRDGFEDGDGCPDLDNDGDRLLDEVDACPDEAEDGRRPEPGDGCPRR